MLVSQFVKKKEMRIKVHFCIELLCVPGACTSQFQSSFAFVVSVSYLTIQVHILPAKMFNKEILVVVEVLSHNYSKKFITCTCMVFEFED